MVKYKKNPRWEPQRKKLAAHCGSWYSNSYSTNNPCTEKDANFYLGEKLEPVYLNLDEEEDKKYDYDRTDPTLDEETMLQKNAEMIYAHLKDPLIEGFEEQPYCDSVGLSSVGPGANISNRKELDGFTMTPHDGLPGVNNPAYTSEQKDEFHQRHQNFCNSLMIKDKNGLMKFPNMSAGVQRNLYKKKYGEDLPYFQEPELDAWGINRIKTETIPSLAQKLKNNYGIDYFRDLGRFQRMGSGDMEYNLGRSRFKLDGVHAKGHWPGIHGGFLEKDWETIADESHRRDVSDFRNEMIRDYFLRED